MRNGKAIATDVRASQPALRATTSGSGSEAWGTYRPQVAAAVGIHLTRYRIVRGAARRFVGNYLKDAQPYFDIEVDGMKMRCASRDNTTSGVSSSWVRARITSAAT
jgi:hypothetical protein